MHVVADASPLRYLILIGHIDLLPALFTQIIIPRAVLGELQRTQTPPMVRRWMQPLPVWCVVRAPQQPLATGLEVLGAGEREALALAEELHADLVLIDEDKGRQRARSLGLRVTGTLRRECLDFMMPLAANHLRRLLHLWAHHYNAGRPHMSLGPGIPQPSAPLPAALYEHRHRLPHQSRVVACPILGGLHHDYRLVQQAS